MTTLTPVDVSALDGPEWLRLRREAAARRAAETPLPSVGEEIWRYSRIDELDLDRFQAPSSRPEAPPGLPGGLSRWLEPVADRAALLVTVNGHLARRELAADAAAAGLVVGAAPEGALGSVMAEPTDAFAQLNDALMADPLLVAVPERATITAPVVVLHWFDAEAAAAYPRLVVRAEAASSLTVVEIFVSSDVGGFVAPVVELAAERDARLGYLNVQRLGRRVWQVASQVAAVGTQAHLVSSTAAFGGEYARVRTDCRLVGRGAHGDLVSLYYGDGDQMLDFRTFQDHQAPDTTSDLLFKGVVADRSHSVYSGLIRVEREARGTNAFQTNRNIKLGEHAWAESVPNLEIENNDVKCSHASTVGPIDAEQRFYLESRGVPPEVADRLIVNGFFDEVIERLPVTALAPLVRSEVTAKLSGLDNPGGPAA
ncbi:MAG: Fe-S cluster assembly protein SufD [Acidimicrobiia bacterium]|nr:Fe-S cluster assembly protein SufD [Acidimicrobiia bacterium]